MTNKYYLLTYLLTYNKFGVVTHVRRDVSMFLDTTRTSSKVWAPAPRLCSHQNIGLWDTYPNSKVI